MAAFGYLCSNYPVELLLAAGHRPVRILPVGPVPAGGMLPSFLCAPARAYLARALSGEYRHLAGVGITHACDAMQCLAQAWQVLVPDPPLFLLRFPTRRDSAALGHLAGEMQRLAASLPVPVEAGALAGSMSWTQARRLELYELLLRRDSLAPAGVWDLLSAPWEPQLPTVPLRASHDGVRIVLSGSILSAPTILEMIDEAGGVVVGDDLCSGERGVGPPPTGREPPPGLRPGAGGGGGAPGPPEDPWVALAGHYLHLPPCPCRHPSLRERASHLQDLVQSRRARGVVMVREKFCEAHRWENEAILAAIRQMGIPALELETEAGTVAGERDFTRLQAFLETMAP